MRGPSRVRGLDVELAPPAHGPTGVADLNAPGGGAACCRQGIGVDGRRRPVRTVGSDHGMEVHQSPALELGHLGVLEAQDLGHFGSCDPERRGEVAGDVDGGASPQLGADAHSAGRRRHSRSSGRTTECRVPRRRARAGRDSSASGRADTETMRAPADMGPSSVSRWTAPNPGAVRVMNTAGCSATDSSMPLPPSSPARTR